MTKLPTTVSTKDWLGDGMIMPFPVPTETQTISSSSADEKETAPDDERMLRESSEEEEEEVCAVG